MRKELLHVFSLTNTSDNDNNDVGGKEALGVTSFLRTWAQRSCQKKNFTRKLPIIEWLPKYTISQLIADIIAGLTLGLTTIPQVLGVANVAELPPQYGLYSSFVGSFLYIFFGSTRYITVGPTVTSSIVTLSYTKGQPPEFSVLLAFLTGVATLLMSFLQLGFIVNFISKPVISGFTSAAAISITSTQIKALLGLSFNANGFIEEISGIIENINDTQWTDAVVALVSLSSLYFLMKIEIIFNKFGTFSKPFNKFLWLLSTSRSVIVVVVATVIFAYIGDPSPVLVVGKVPSGMPEFKAPPFEFSEWDSEKNATVEFSLGSALREKTSALIVIPFIAFMEHMTIAKAFAGTDRVDATQELLALGLSNLVGSFFSSIPVTGAFGRTALNKASGAQSPIGGVLTGSIIILALVFLTPQFFYIPKATLNSVVIMAVIFMVDLDILVDIWRSKKWDLVPWIVTFAVSLFLGLEYGILSGFAVSIIFLLYYASRPGVRVNKGETIGGLKFLWLEVDRSLTFPSVEYTRYTVTKASLKWGHQDLPVVLDCKNVTFADYTAAHGMCDLIKLFRERNQEIIMWQVKPSIRRVWEGVISKRGLKDISFCADESELQIQLELMCKLLEEKKLSAVVIAENNNSYDPDETEDNHI